MSDVKAILIVEINSDSQGDTMPDGDIIRGLERLYHKPYKALSEGKATSDEYAHSLKRSLKKDIKNKGDLPIRLAKSMGESLTRTISDAGGIIFVDWAALRQEFNRLVEQVESSHYLKELVLRAGKSVLHELEHGREVDIDCPSEAILRGYMTEIYETFKESIPPDADEAILERLEQIEPNILTTIHQWAKKADTDESVRKLRLPPLRKAKEADNLEDDLLAAQNHNNCRKIDELLQIASKDLQITNQELKQYFSARDGAPV